MNVSHDNIYRDFKESISKSDRSSVALECMFHKVVKLYRIRWKIEMFHRTAKQYLGLSDCQMRNIESQLQHVLNVMLAYAKASVQKTELSRQYTKKT